MCYRGEANVALDLHKPIFVVTPPVSDDQKVKRADIPLYLKKSMSERQFFAKFAEAKLYDTGLGELANLCMLNKAKWGTRNHKSHMNSRLLNEKPQLYLPLGLSTDPAANHKYVCFPSFLYSFFPLPRWLTFSRVFGRGGEKNHRKQRNARGKGVGSYWGTGNKAYGGDLKCGRLFLSKSDPQMPAIPLLYVYQQLHLPHVWRKNIRRTLL